MIKYSVVLLAVMLTTANTSASDDNWYTGDERCPPPKDDGTYSRPYRAQDHPHEYPTFSGADKSGWSCSYSREDGVIVQYGDSRTPQQQWTDLYAGGDSNNN